MTQLKIPSSKQGALQVIKFHTKLDTAGAEALFNDLQKLAGENAQTLEVGNADNYFSSANQATGKRGFRYEQYKKNNLLVAIDYDDTWTRQTKIWKQLVANIKRQGGSCICVTSRHKDTNDGELTNSIGKHMTILYAKGKPKEKVAKEKGYSVDIWIDNKPETINKGSSKKDMADLRVKHMLPASMRKNDNGGRQRGFF